MAGGSPVGLVYVEVAMDYTPYTRAQKNLLKSVTSTTLNIEKSYTDLGIKSAKTFDLMRAKVHNAYNRIAADAKSTAQDILMAEKAKNHRLKMINEQQTRQAKGEFKNIYNSHKTMTEKIIENWKAIAAGIVFVGVTKVLSQIKEIAKESTLLAARYETLGVVMEVVGRNVGVSSDEMVRFQKALMKTGISAVESRQNLIRMSQANIDLEKSTQLARIAQDAAVIGMMNSSQAFNNMIYGIQTGQIRVLRTIGLNVNFEQSYKKLAARIGKTTDELTDYEKMQARVNTVIDAGRNIVGAYESSMTTASKQMYSMQRYIGNLKVAFGEAFRPAFAELIKSATQAIKDMQEVVADPQFRENLSSIAMGFGKIATSLMELMKYANLRSTIETALLARDLKEIGRLPSEYDFAKNALEKQKIVDLTIQELGLTREIVQQMAKVSELERDLRRQEENRKNLGLLGKAIGYDTKSAQGALKNARDRLAETLNMFSATKLDVSLIEGISGIEKKYKDFQAKRSYEQRMIDEKADADRLAALAQRRKEQDEMWKAMQKNAKAAYKSDQEAYVAAAEFAAKGELENIKNREKAYSKMYSDLKFNSEDYYNYQLDKLQRQADDYETFTGNAYLAHKWLTEQIKILDQERLQAEHEKNTYLMDMSERTAEAIEDNFSSFFKDVWRGELDSASDYFREFCYSITDSFSEMMGQMVKEMLFGGGSAGGSGLFGNMFFGLSGLFGGGGTELWGGYSAITWAKGGAFDKGNIQRFSSGAVISKPTIFPMANGAGLMGEAGPEGILPLARTSSGELGVKTTGDDTAGDTNNYITIHAVDSKSFVELLNRDPDAVLSVTNKALGKNSTGRHRLKRMVSR